MSTHPGLPEDTRHQPAVVSCHDLRRNYGKLVAVNGVSFDIRPAETYGLLGPNGAGKTTVISIIAGVLQADAGQVTVAGRPITPRAIGAKAAIGYVPQELALYPDLTGRENLRFFAKLYGLRSSETKRRVDEVLGIIGLSERAGQLVSTYSGGMKRRLNIAAGLLHRPNLLILDEPTVGVDPQSRNAILGNIETLAREGMAVLYTTHYMEEAQRLCDRVGVLDEGKLIAEGTVRELTAMVGEQDRVRLTVAAEPQELARRLNASDLGHSAAVDGNEITLLVKDAPTALPAILDLAGQTVRSVIVEEPDLEAVFLHLTGKSLRD
ncbi:ABC transporter ATP-binding protein [Catelliglobosispora koreensis]|uniref:ABC transporter ATP-binding protein n=1 Tax=Catelliglobosispora koreensis TaxID=129052 RepID=UPI00036B954F|nr:ABC transporter ATP-binding protein [Catelliglobosispora koreensis]